MGPNTRSIVRRSVPSVRRGIALAPMAGGPSTPEIRRGRLGGRWSRSPAAGYLSAAVLAEQIEQTRALTSRPFGVNLFVPGPRHAPETYEAYVAGFGEPKFNDDDWDAKLEVVKDIPVVSFTFGCPAPKVLRAFEETWVTVTRPDQARQAYAAGATAVIAQGAEAGGHRGSFDDDDDAPIGLIALLQLIDGPKVATGGIATPEAVKAVTALGAKAAQVGTAFMRAPEAGTTPVHADRLATEDATGLTRAFSGRLARGIQNRFMAEHEHAPSAYPEIHYATSKLRAEARKNGDSDGFNLWAGQAHQLAQARPAAEITRWLAGEQPGVEDELRAGDGPGPVRGQEHDGLGDVPRLDPGHRQQVAGRALGDLARRLALERRQAVVHRRVDAGRVDRDDADVVRRQLDRPRLGQARTSPHFDAA